MCNPWVFGWVVKWARAVFTYAFLSASVEFYSLSLSFLMDLRCARSPPLGVDLGFGDVFMYIHIGKGAPDASAVWVIYKSDHPKQIS